MIPPSRKLEYEKVKTDDFVTGTITEIKYDMEHKSSYQGKEKIGPACRFTFEIDGYKYPHGTPWMFFGYGEKTNLYKKYISSLVQNAEPDMEFDLDQLKGMKVKILWKDNGDFQHVDVIRPSGQKIVPKIGGVKEENDAIEQDEDQVPFQEEIMKIELSGSIKRIGSRLDVSNDIVNTIVLEIYGDMDRVSKILKAPLQITLETSEGLPE